MEEAVELRASVLLADQVYRIVSELEWIERRLGQLGDSDEDRVEAIVLRALQKHLVNELREISWVTHTPTGSGQRLAAPTRGEAVVKA